MINHIFMIGNLTREPELAETSNGIAICRFSIAVNRPYSKDGEATTDFFNITTWRKQAENCGRYLKKGSKVAIVGTLQNRSYEDREGNKKTVTDIIANEVEFLSKINESGPPTQQRLKETEVMSDDEDLPF